MNRGLISHQKAYQQNYRVLEAMVDTPMHQTYVRIEKVLNRIGIELRERIGVLAKDPCPLTGCIPISCESCTGRYSIKIIKKKHIKVYISKYGSRLCEIKKISGGRNEKGNRSISSLHGYGYKRIYKGTGHHLKKWERGNSGVQTGIQKDRKPDSTAREYHTEVEISDSSINCPDRLCGE